MPFQLQHILASEQFEPQTHESFGEVFFTVGQQARFSILFAGRLSRVVNASVLHRIDRSRTPDGEPIPGPQIPVQVNREAIPLDVLIFDPEGNQFDRDEVTLEDLRKFRDLRGTPRGHWLLSVSGRSRTYRPSMAFDESVTDPQGAIALTLLETIPSASAPPLVANEVLRGSRQQFRFDLWREGTFVAQVVQSTPSDRWNGSMRLLDPDGVQVARTRSRELTRPIVLTDLAKSRDAAGAVREWVLEVSPQGGLVVGRPRIFATVIGQGRISTGEITKRIPKLIGPNPTRPFIKLVGENSGDQVLATMTITDGAAAETIDMLGLLDKALTDAGQPTALEVNQPFIIYKRSDLFDDLKLHVSSLRLESLQVAVGRGRQLGSEVPAVILTAAVSGEVKLGIELFPVATVKLTGGRLEFEVGIKLDPDGTPRVVTAGRDNALDVDGILAELKEGDVNKDFSAAVRGLFDDPSLAPRILMTIFGAHLTYRSIRFEGDDIVFEHIAPLEPDLKPRPNYAGAIGRSIRRVQEFPGVIQFNPATLGDTWASSNLRKKIRHIVVVMMENRSHDHVLGYRARDPFNEPSDGLTPDLIDDIQRADAAHVVRALRGADFAANGVRATRLPVSVGHDVADVREQLSSQIAGRNGRQINNPQGFVDNFVKKLDQLEDPEKVVPIDVLGFYEAADLPIYAHLASNYAYCDRFFCSHPGPTLPNRMYSLTGDLQYDRHGFPIADNNNGDNFLLSRAETIFDLLTKRGISWRVYETLPSAAMLRMFARYATNGTEIVTIDRLEADIAAGDLPAFTCIEPQMHSFPPNDDHPPADMWHGQHFIKRVYDALRSKPAIWRETLLIITYDEHGGFYDHVVPPLADVLKLPGGPGGTRGIDATPDDGRAPTGGGVNPVPIPITGGIDRDPDQDRPRPPDPTVKISYGLRVPTFVVSPWTTAGKGPGLTLDFCSILKTVLACFAGDQKPFLSDRVNASHSFESFLSAAEPRMDVEASPDLADPIPLPRLLLPGASQIVTPPLMRRQMREGPVEFHDLSGRLARMLGR